MISRQEREQRWRQRHPLQKRAKEKRYYLKLQTDPQRKARYLARKRMDAQRRIGKRCHWKDPLTGRWKWGTPRDVLPHINFSEFSTEVSHEDFLT